MIVSYNLREINNEALLITVLVVSAKVCASFSIVVKVCGCKVSLVSPLVGMF